MTDNQKASKVLNFMEEEWDGKTIINVLNLYLKDEDLADLYDQLKEEGFL